MVVKSSSKLKKRVAKLGGDNGKMSGVLHSKLNSDEPKGALRKEKVMSVNGKKNAKQGKGKLKTCGVMQTKLKSPILNSGVRKEVLKSEEKTSVMQKKFKSPNQLNSGLGKEKVLKSEGRNIKVGRENVETIGVMQTKRKSTDESINGSLKKQKFVNEKSKKMGKVGKRKRSISKGVTFFQRLESVSKKMGKSGDALNGEKPNWKEAKKVYLELKEERKKKKLTDYETIVRAKKMWEEVRHDKCPLEKRAKLIASLYEILEDKLTKLVFQHDTSRIVQWLLKLGTPLIRSNITKILRSQIKNMILLKFSRCCVKNMVKYGDQECRHMVFSEINGHVVKCMSSVVSAPIMEFIYSIGATPEEKLLFRREFYGKMLKLVSDAQVSSLKDALSLKDVRKDVLVDTKTNILQVVSKRVPVSQLMHSIILEYLKLCDDADRHDIIDILYPQYMELVKTREGAEIAMTCCWFTSAKVKKTILKSLKDEVKEVCMLPYGYLFMMALLDSVDDTVSLRKYVLNELLTNVIELLSRKEGRKVLTYLVAHRNLAYFSPELISLLKTADSSIFVRKDMDIRRSEILEVIMAPLAKIISNDVTPWFQNPSSAMVLMAVLNAGKGDIMMDVFCAVASYICQDIQVPVGKEKIALVEHRGFNFVIKRVMKNETDEESLATLSYQLADHLSKEVIWRWIESNRGCFVLVYILESKNKSASKVLMGKLTQDMKKHIAKGDSIGANTLRKKLSDSESN